VTPQHHRLLRRQARWQLLHRRVRWERPGAAPLIARDQRKLAAFVLRN
jgi:hypothetical protein